jgi:DNA-binding transcriptional MerR regulator
MGHYTLHVVEKLTGIHAATIRVWERRYNILKPERTGTNRRLYDDDDLKRLINISIIYKRGIKISKIAEYSESELEEKVRYLTSGSVISDTYIKSLIHAMLSFNGNAINEILFRSVMNNGFEVTFTNVVFPVLKKVGIMWHSGTVCTGAEHFITNIFRGRLISAIEALPPRNCKKSKRVIMFLPENELHELGLLFYAYLIKKMGHEVLYLGQFTPFNTISEVNEKWHSDILVTGTLSELPIFEPKEYLHNLSITFRSQKILVAGSLADKTNIRKYKNIYPIRSASELKKYF